ncbi:hypothetical protein CYMTET_4257 [Cymbomonas tetramitiformis]|uniref:Uncharacterized protein n=1 Tax=Cymbomonas tetramitiformis TaxID=36881 RepID=A0AAE0LK15_9CHLO|nr:hypothetical protein CYMTET_26719 [Cymbomonas tetramitiformis]KAK3288256.1 hypothetical protein CYMTET_4257 [Cymbomonas tetramitiformis]
MAPRAGGAAAAARAARKQKDLREGAASPVDEPEKQVDRKNIHAIGSVTQDGDDDAEDLDFKQSVLERFQMLSPFDYLNASDPDPAFGEHVSFENKYGKTVNPYSVLNHAEESRNYKGAGLMKLVPDDDYEEQEENTWKTLSLDPSAVDFDKMKEGRPDSADSDVPPWMRPGAVDDLATPREETIDVELEVKEAPPTGFRKLVQQGRAVTGKVVDVRRSVALNIEAAVTGKKVEVLRAEKERQMAKEKALMAETMGSKSLFFYMGKGVLGKAEEVGLAFKHVMGIQRVADTPDDVPTYQETGLKSLGNDDDERFA